MEDRVEAAVEGRYERFLQGVRDRANVPLFICTVLVTIVSVFQGEIQHRFVGVRKWRKYLIFIILLFISHILIFTDPNSNVGLRGWEGRNQDYISVVNKCHIKV